jgi:DNA repair exonuclease SbcCD ATPase subunit
MYEKLIFFRQKPRKAHNKPGCSFTAFDRMPEGDPKDLSRISSNLSTALAATSEEDSPSDRYETVKEALQTAHDDLTTLKDEIEAKKTNVGEVFHEQGEVYEQLSSRLETMETIVSELEAVQSDIEALDPEEEDSNSFHMELTNSLENIPEMSFDS